LSVASGTRFDRRPQMPEINEPVAALLALTSEHSDLVSRIAAPLWSRVGRKVDEGDLNWARTLLGESAPQLLMHSLQQFGALDAHSGALTARGLSRMICALLGVATTDASPVRSPELVWTLPQSHPAHTVRGQAYPESCLRLINEASESLTLISPYVDPGGIGIILGPLTAALSRAVVVRLFVHDALNVGTPTSLALEELRREAERIRGDLSVFSAEAGPGRGRLLNPLFHAKLIVCDDQTLLLGSANLTSYGLGANFEAGVVLGPSSAREALFILDGVLRSQAVYLVFSTKKT